MLPEALFGIYIFSCVNCLNGSSLLGFYARQFSQPFNTELLNLAYKWRVPNWYCVAPVVCKSSVN